MFGSLVSWLDDYLDGEDSSVIVKAVIGIMSFAALVGVVLGNVAIKTGLLVAVILVFLSLMLLLLRDRKRLKYEINVRDELLTRYCDRLYDEGQSIVRVKDWHQVATIGDSGDVQELITIQAEVLQDNLYFLRFRTDPKWAQPRRYRSGVRFSFRGVNSVGDRGPSWWVTPLWLPDGRFEMLAHSHSPIPRGTEIRIEVEREWPGKCVPLVKGRGSDSFGFYFSNALRIEHAEYVVVLPKGVEVYYEPAGFQLPHPDFALRGGRNREGRYEVTLTVDNLPVDTHIDMLLQRKV